MRPWLSALLLLCAAHGAPAQVLSGRLPLGSEPGARLVLRATRGHGHYPVDSVRPDRKGRFYFNTDARPLGYYRLGIGNDQVDLILDPAERHVQVRFGTRPLQDDVSFTGSPENERLWEYKRASRHAQEELRAIAAQRSAADPLDAPTLIRLAREEDRVRERLGAVMDRLMAQDSASYFAKVVRMDQRIMAALNEGPAAIREAMDWTDPSLVRCAIYPKALFAVLQAATPATPSALAAASDSVLAWAAGDTACWSYARWQLIDVFSTYGPQEVVQHLVDRYVAGPGALTPPDGAMLALVAEQLKAAIGAPAPDIALPSPITGSTDRLLALVQPYSYTVLFFYSSICDHCHAEMPPLNAIYERYGRKGLNIIGIALDHDEAEFRANIAERGLRFPCYSELQAWGSPAAKAFAVRATPWLIVLDRTGRIVAKPNSSAELEEMLPALLP